MRITERPAVGGVVATIAGLATSELVAGIAGPSVTPVLAVGESIIALTPGSVAEKAIGAVGQLDKPLLVVGVVAGALAIGAGLGSLVPRRPQAAFGGFAAMALLGVVAVLTRSDSRPVEALSALVGGIVATMVLRWFNRFAAQPEGRSAEAIGADRRTFLRNVGLVLAGSALVAGAGRWVGRARSVVEDARAGLALPVKPADVPAGADLGVRGVAPWLTPNDEFYRIDTALTPPLIDPTEWSLRIHGMVEREMTLSYDDLLERGLENAWVTLCCVSNEVGGELIGNTEWSGVPIKAILSEVGIKAGADALLSTSEDGWSCGTPLGALTDGRSSLLAVAMNGRPLPVDHGFPVRQVVPGLYGYVSATKWVVDWEVTTLDRIEAYWTQRGWGEKGPIKTQSRIDTPRGDVDAGTVKVAGVAWAQHRGIEKVEVRVDEGPWREATLATVPGIDTWVQWVWDWDAERGDHTLEVRATDKTSAPQTAKVADVLPDGATGYHGVGLAVR